jgi:hypothetical protein
MYERNSIDRIVYCECGFRDELKEYEIMVLCPMCFKKLKEEKIKAYIH